MRNNQRGNEEMGNNLSKPLLLTDQVNRFQWETPVDRPQYNDRFHIGIMCRKRSRRVVWCFVYRGDGCPIFNAWFDDVRHFSNGFAAVRRGEKWHFVTIAGKTACRHRFLDVGSVDINGQVLVLHPDYVDPVTKLPVWTAYTLPAFVTK